MLQHLVNAWWAGSSSICIAKGMDKSELCVHESWRDGRHTQRHLLRTRLNTHHKLNAMGS